MRVAELMHKSLHTISVDATVADAVSALAEARVSAFLFRTTHVLEIMEPWPPTTSPEAEVRGAAQDMLRHATQRLFVEQGGALVGVLSQTDIVAALAAGRLAAVGASGRA